MKMQILSMGKNYDVMDPNQTVLCRIGLDLGQNVSRSDARKCHRGLHWEVCGPEHELHLQGEGSRGNVGLEIRKTGGGITPNSKWSTPSWERRSGLIEMKRGLMGGLDATWVAPSGQPLMNTKGSILHRQCTRL